MTLANHLLVQGIQKALGWSDVSPLGVSFSRGHLPDPSICRRLMTSTRLLDIVTRRSLEPPQLRCFKNGAELHPSDYLRSAPNRRRQTIRVVDQTAVTWLLDTGATLVLDALDTFDPTMDVATRALQWWSHELVQVNAYLTTRSSAGFPIHWDDHDVIVVQLAGAKTWDVRSYSRRVPMYRDADPNSEVSDDIVWQGTMEPGDVMHIPRGYWHQATRDGSQDPLSLHLTFGFVKRTGVDWLASLADRAREVELFRQDLTRSPEDRESERQRLEAAAIDLLRTYPPGAYLRSREVSQPPARQAPHFPPGELPTSVVCVTEFAPELQRGEDAVTVHAAGKRLTVKGKAEGALSVLLSGRPVDVLALNEASGLDVRPLAGTLVEEGICAHLTDESRSGYTGLVTAEAS
ncbi:cupin [Frankia sp. R43]|uniref:JmjC domain-containing protein n=1 Tax=Frankia sp. R43 TaxID=269536 RepID=UPI0006CA0669|nr:cupin domain-containing protein [Frankia sp. R43]KPM52889.1 cupin [Frankia sp. R43]